MTRGQDGTVRLPFGNMRFRVEIDGISGGGAFEVVFPEARIAGRGRNGRRELYGPLILRRGLTAACDWYDWWDTARRARTPASRFVCIVLLDSEGADAMRWRFRGALPVAYHLSPLQALGDAPVIESLELSIAGFTADDEAPRQSAGDLSRSRRGRR